MIRVIIKYFNQFTTDMKLLVCGGAGFMGSHFIKYILKKYPDYNIVNYDKLTYAGNLDNLKEVRDNPRYAFMQADIINASQLETIIKKYDIDN